MVDAVIVGAGLSGLACTIRLENAGLSVLLLEQDHVPGGRVRTDLVDGFRLDRGFQILLTAYPETQRLLDYKALRLRGFVPGALVWRRGRFHHFADPFRDSLGAALGLLFDPVITMGDKVRVAALRARVSRGPVRKIFDRPEFTTREFLRRYGFSPKIIERFFTPFFGGVFLEQELATSSRFFEFLFRMFALGGAAVPEAGMGMIPQQLAVRLRTDTILPNTRVTRVRRERNGFAVEAGPRGEVQARAVVLAVPATQARALLRGLNLEFAGPSGAPAWHCTTTLYYAAPQPPVDRAILLLNGEGVEAGPVNNVAVMSLVSPRYAPPGRHLIAASVVGQAPQDHAQMETLDGEARAQLERWFGIREVARWSVLGGYPIQHALPLCLHAEWERSRPEIAPGLFLCGDDCETPSIQGALASGRRAAEGLLQFLRPA